MLVWHDDYSRMTTGREVKPRSAYADRGNEAAQHVVAPNGLDL
jgi:hypothetical protein